MPGRPVAVCIATSHYFLLSGPLGAIECNKMKIRTLSVHQTATAPPRCAERQTEAVADEREKGMADDDDGVQRHANQGIGIAELRALYAGLTQQARDEVARGLMCKLPKSRLNLLSGLMLRVLTPGQFGASDDPDTIAMVVNGLVGLSGYERSEGKREASGAPRIDHGQTASKLVASARYVAAAHGVPLSPWHVLYVLMRPAARRTGRGPARRLLRRGFPASDDGDAAQPPDRRSLLAVLRDLRGRLGHVGNNMGDEFATALAAALTARHLNTRWSAEREPRELHLLAALLDTASPVTDWLKAQGVDLALLRARMDQEARGVVFLPDSDEEHDPEPSAEEAAIQAEMRAALRDLQMEFALLCLDSPDGRSRPGLLVLEWLQQRPQLLEQVIDSIGHADDGRDTVEFPQKAIREGLDWDDTTCQKATRIARTAFLEGLRLMRTVAQQAIAAGLPLDDMATLRTLALHLTRSLRARKARRPEQTDR